jgi:membrane protease YdiL (CAAX protease family)
MTDTPVVSERPPAVWLRMVGAAAFLTVAYLALAIAGEAVAVVSEPVTIAAAVASIVVTVALAVTAIRMASEFSGVEEPVRGLIVGTRRSMRGAVVPVIVAIIAQVIVAPQLERLAFNLGLRGTTALVGPRPGFTIALVLSCYAVVEAPWLEEVSMRGFLFTGLQRRFGFWPAALVSAFVWAALHREAEVLVAFTAVGISLAWLRQQTGSVRSGILLHGLWNTVVSVHAFGWGPVIPADALLLTTLVLARRDWTLAPLTAVRAALTAPRRLAGFVCDRMPHGPPLGSRATVLAGLILLAGYGAQTAGAYGDLGASAGRQVTLIAVPAMLLLAGVAMATRRSWRPPGALALAAVCAGLLDAGVRCVTGLGGGERISDLTAPAAVILAWWLWGVSRAAQRRAVRRSAAVASLAYMAALIEPIPTGLWDIAWHCSMLLLAAGSIVWLGLATRRPAATERPLRSRTLALDGRRLGVMAGAAALAISAGIVAIPHPGGDPVTAQAVVHPGDVCAPDGVGLHVGLDATGSQVRSFVAASAPAACRPDRLVVVHVRLTAANGRSLPTLLAGLAPVERWVSTITANDLSGAMRDADARARWCADDPQPGPYTLTASIAGGASASATAMICGPHPVAAAFRTAIPVPEGATPNRAAGPSCYGHHLAYDTTAGLLRSFASGRLSAVAWPADAAADLARFTGPAAVGYVTARPGTVPQATGLFVIAVYRSGGDAARNVRDPALILARARAALRLDRLPAGTRLRVFRDGNLVVFELLPPGIPSIGMADMLENATVSCA